VLLANVRFLAGYRYVGRMDTLLAGEIMRQAPGAVSVGELEDALARPRG
jgi:hypothetical protein